MTSNYIALKLTGGSPLWYNYMTLYRGWRGVMWKIYNSLWCGCV